MAGASRMVPCVAQFDGAFVQANTVPSLRSGRVPGQSAEYGASVAGSSPTYRSVLSESSMHWPRIWRVRVQNLRGGTLRGA